MIVETIRDKKLVSLYTALTNSDFKGEIEEVELVCILYAMLCIDLSRKDYEEYFNKNLKSPLDFVRYAKELIRVYETSLNGEHNENSVMFLADAMLYYLSKNDISYSVFHSMNGYELKKKIYESVCLDIE